MAKKKNIDLPAICEGEVKAELIPQFQIDRLARSLLERAREDFKRPEFQAEFEQWLKEKQAKEAAEGKEHHGE